MDIHFLPSTETTSVFTSGTAAVNIALMLTSGGILRVYWAVLCGGVCVSVALIKGISTDYNPPLTRGALSAVEQRSLELGCRSDDEIRIRHAEAPT